ncbi:MAG: aldehyde ferredoxin oxidoreductase C-terminal domain-containing protein [Planctomycetota bacterium JB042]
MTTVSPPPTSAGIRARVDALLERLHDTPRYPTQGCVLLVDLERQETRRGYLPIEIVRRFLGGRGSNMVLLYSLLDESLDPLHPDVPLIFGTGILTGFVPSAARGNVTSWAPDSGVLMDANCGDFVPGFMKMHGYDHIVLYGRAKGWSLLHIDHEHVGFVDASPYVGLDNIDLRPKVAEDFGVREGATMAMASITTAGENLVNCAGIMGGPKAIYARGGPGAKMGSLRLKALLLTGSAKEPPTHEPFKKFNGPIAKKVLGTSVVKNALKTVGTPFLYKPSRVLGAMGTKNNQVTTWTEELDADNIDPYRPGMAGCFKCPVNCRPLNDMTPEGKGYHGAGAMKGLKGNASYDLSQVDVAHETEGGYRKTGRHGDGTFDKYDKGDGPEYVTLGKFGPMVGVTTIEHVLRLNNICNDLGLDTSSTGSAIAWAMELWERGLITEKETGGLDLSWGNFESIERLLFLIAKREGFGDVVADSARAVETGKYPAEALKYRMAVKGLFQSDPHDARILKAFALGLAVATRGMDHLRNRVTLEINARINDDEAFKTSLYGGKVAPEPNSYEGKEIAVRKCENTFAAGDAVGMCRFTTKLFNSPSLPEYAEFKEQIGHVTGLEFDEAELDECGRWITGLERMINARLGVRAKDDTLPDRWFDEGTTYGPFLGEKVDREEFRKMRSRFYEVTGLDAEGAPKTDWRRELARLATGFEVRVKLPAPVDGAPDGVVVVDRPARTVGALLAELARVAPEAAGVIGDESVNVAVNGEMLLSGASDHPISTGDAVELIRAFSGG